MQKSGSKSIYVRIYFINSALRLFVNAIMINVPGSDIIVRGLQPSTRYILSVAGENEVGVGPAGQVDAETEAECEYIIRY